MFPTSQLGKCVWSDGEIECGQKVSKEREFETSHSYGQATVISNSPQIYLAPVNRSPKINKLDLSWLDIPDQQNKKFSYKP